jgi:tRNA uridine 5-carbamoylmethylation protein Kti12
MQKIPDIYYKVGVFFVDFTLEMLLERNKQRPGKFIPEEILQNMCKSYEIPSKVEPWFNNHIFVSAITGEVRDRVET